MIPANVTYQTSGDPADPVPCLPTDLVDDILIHAALALPCVHMYRSYLYRPDLGQECTELLQVLPLACASNTLIHVLLPRLGTADLLSLFAHVRFTTQNLVDLDCENCRYSAHARLFLLVLLANRVDLLAWWADEAELRIPDLQDLMCDELCSPAHPVHVAANEDAWDALVWIAECDDADQLCHEALSGYHLADMVNSRQEKQLKFVEAWVRQQHRLYKTSANLIFDAAFDTRALSVLEAMYQGDPWQILEYNDEPEWVDSMCCTIIQEHLVNVTDWLDWMLCAEWCLLNVAEYASEFGNLDVLEWWEENKEQVESVLTSQWDIDMQSQEFWDEVAASSGSESSAGGTTKRPSKRGLCMDLASQQGHIHVLEWWSTHLDILPRVYSANAMDWASRNGRIDVLKWWKEKSGLQLLYSHRAFCYAMEFDRMDVLEWWAKKSDLSLEFDSAEVIRTALESGKWREWVHWWLNRSGAHIPLGECSSMIEECSEVDMLERWRLLDHFIPVNVAKAVCLAIERSDFTTLEWWKTSPLAVPLNTDPQHVPMDVASAQKCTELLACVRSLYLAHGAEIHYTINSLDCLDWPIPIRFLFNGGKYFPALPAKHSLQVVKWWFESGLELKYSERAFVNAFLVNTPADAKWWLEIARLPVRYTKAGVERAMCAWGPTAVAQLLQEHGLEPNVEWEQTKGGDYVCKALNGAWNEDFPKF